MAKAKAKPAAKAAQPPEPHSTTRISNLDAAWASAYAEKAQRGDPVAITNLIPAKGEFDQKGAAARVKVKRAARVAASKADPRDALRVVNPAAAYFDALAEDRERSKATVVTTKGKAPAPAKAKAKPPAKVKPAGPQHLTKWNDVLERMHRGFLPELSEESDDTVEFVPPDDDVQLDDFDTAPVALMDELVKLGLVIAPTSKWDDRAGWIGEAAYTLATLRPKAEKAVPAAKLPRFMQPDPVKPPAAHTPKVSPFRDRSQVKTDRDQLTPEAKARIDADLARAKGLPDPGYYSEQFTEL